MHYYIKGNRTQYSIVKVFCFLKGKKTDAHQEKRDLKKITFAVENKACSTFNSFFSSKENVTVVWFFNMCLQRDTKFPLKSKMQPLSQEEFAPLYLNALIRTREYHITLFYHNTRSKPMFFFHISLGLSRDLFMEN